MSSLSTESTIAFRKAGSLHGLLTCKVVGILDEASRRMSQTEQLSTQRRRAGNNSPKILISSAPAPEKVFLGHPPDWHE
jgi:hypothetical protein